MIQEIHFVTGKGGVGKSVIAAALAFKKSQEGKKVLLVELGDQSFYRDYFDLPQVGFQPTPLKPNLSVALWTGETSLREYATYLIKVDSLAKIFFENAVMKAFINVAPALPELAIMGKITSGPRKHGPPLNYDVLVVDAFATGHFMALMEAPKGMAQAVKMGPMGEQSRSIDTHIRNENLCKFHVVTLPEELPVKEASELLGRLKSEFNISAELILNKVLKVPVSAETLKSAEKENGDLGQFAGYLSQQIERQSKMIEAGRSLTKKSEEVPLLFESDSWKIIEQVERALS
ncbi:Anion-transporting ATPase [compost metagenome]